MCFPATWLDLASARQLESSKFEYFPKGIFVDNFIQDHLLGLGDVL